MERRREAPRRRGCGGAGRGRDDGRARHRLDRRPSAAGDRPRGLSGIRCVATSVATEEQARGLGIPVEEFSELERLDIAIDGTDQVTPDGWLIKGGGGAHQREKIVAAAAERFVVIADSSKPVERSPRPCRWSCFAFGLALDPGPARRRGRAARRAAAAPTAA